MLVRIICKNMEKKNVALYSVSIVLAAALETILGAALMADDTYGLRERTGAMHWLCTMFFAAAGTMSVLFVLYATVYYVRTKNKDYSLLLMLGGGRKFLFKFFSVEFLLVYTISVLLGILAGGLFSALFLLVPCIGRYFFTVSFADIFQIIKIVVKINSALFLFEYPLILLYFCKRDLTDMQIRESKKEGRYNRTGFLVVGGIGLIIAAMRLLQESRLSWHFVSMGISLTGVYICMAYGGSLLLMLIKLFKNFYYRHVIALNEFYYRFKSNCRLLFILFVIDFAILYFMGASVISQMPEDADSPEYPYGFVGVMRDGYLKNAAREMAGADRLEIPAVKGYIDGKTAVFCISDKDYSSLAARDLCLESAEAVWINESTMLDWKIPEFICLGEEDVFAVSEGRNEIIFGTEKPDCLWQLAVLPEAALAERRQETYSIIAKKGNLQKEFERYGYCLQENETDGTDIFWRCAFLKNANEDMAYVKIICAFTGVSCILSCFGIFALKLQGDLSLLNRKYSTLYQIGMSEKEVYKAVSSEYRKLMGIPVVPALLLSGVYMAAEMTDRRMFFRYFVCRYVPFQILFVCLYMAYFCLITKIMLRKNNTSKNNVSKE